MKKIQNTEEQEAMIIPLGITEVFAEAMQTGKISFTCWYELLTAPLSGLECEYEYHFIFITQLISAVLGETVTVVDQEKVEKFSFDDNRPKQWQESDFQELSRLTT